LLKNDNSILPLSKDARVFVAGKNAHDKGNQCGGFSLTWQGQSGNQHLQGGCSIWEGIKQQVTGATLSSTANGSDVDPDKHDVAIIVIGEKPYAEGLGDVRSGDQIIVEAGSQIKGSMDVLEPYGDTLELTKLHPEDLETIMTITRTGVPAVVVLVSGRPLVVNREMDAATAFVAAWLPGSEAQGISDVLFGDFDFQGRLSFSWPASTNDISDQYETKAPKFPYGYGLSYSNVQQVNPLERLSA
jgi:beta-glucosidase